MPGKFFWQPRAQSMGRHAYWASWCKYISEPKGARQNDKQAHFAHRTMLQLKRFLKNKGLSWDIGRSGLLVLILSVHASYVALVAQIQR
jgi:hypothetical protein